MTTAGTPVAVIGAGPYGLSVSAHLSGRGVPHRAFGRVMSLWADHMPRGMYLKSEGLASSLSDPAGASTLRRYAELHDRPYADLGLPVALDLFTDYGRWFQQREVPHLEERDVASLARAGTGFELGLSDGSTLLADRVVLATGMGAFAHVPEQLAGLPPTRITHTSAHDDMAPFAGQDVVVLGAGQSALEAAALLAEAGARPTVLVRRPTTYWNINPAGRGLPARIRHPISRLGPGWRLLACDRLPWVFRRLPAARRIDIVRRALGPAGGWWLKERVDGVVPVVLAAEVRSARLEGEALELTVQGADGEWTLPADRVLAGTGYRVDLTRLAFLDDGLRSAIRTQAGYPVLNGRFESSVPGLHFVGLPAAGSFGPVQRFVCGAGFAARRVAGAVPAAARDRRRATAPARP